MTYDSETFRRRASSLPDDSSDVEVAGHLALAYAALERRRRVALADAPIAPADKPILLQD